MCIPALNLVLTFVATLSTLSDPLGANLFAAIKAFAMASARHTPVLCLMAFQRILHVSFIELLQVVHFIWHVAHPLPAQAR